jgi:photosystem II stability/assembly factor-like uncharacterized protein
MLKRWFVLGCALVLLLSIPALAQWRSLGPYGGNARALAYDPSNPDHILLGSGAGALFESTDGGRHWKNFAHLGLGHDLMLENVAFDPSNTATIYVAGWSVNGSGGGFFVTRNGGRTWSEPADLRGKSLEALALADSDPRILIVGALDGLFRSSDRGVSWTRISPSGHSDLKNFESVAIDSHDPKIIYAGTWHLPWKTTDGGATWNSIKQGLIDDSDVFSIILDKSNPQTVFASACSGIYKSENGGQLFHKVQGIPGTARRTRVLQQDPVDAKTVYAGTTEGLWKTMDGGKVFKLISPPNFILNDVMVDPRNPRRVLIATDRAGVFASDDAGATFHPSNDGFSQRQITAVVEDAEHSSDLYASVVNDKEFGGVFRSHEGTWSQVSDGLGGRDVFDLRQSSKGQLIAATNRGLFLFEEKNQRWEPSNHVVSEKPAALRAPVRGKKGKMTVPKALPPVITHSTFEGRSMALALGSQRWYAATDAGMLMSDNEGKSWSGGALDGEKVFFSVSTHGKTVAAATLRDVWYSSDEAAHWSRQAVPAWVTRIYSVTATNDDTVWIATREGALKWTRHEKGTDATGETGVWEHVLNGLPAREVTSIRRQGELLLAVAAGSKTVYVSRNQGQSWKAEPAAAFEITGASMQGDALYVTTGHNGVLVRESHTAIAGLH